MTGVTAGDGSTINIAEYDWCQAIIRECHCEDEPNIERDCDCIDEPLHAPGAEANDEFDEWDGDPVEGSTACGVKGKLLIPGVGSRMGSPRCVTCCDLLGFPRGDGSPKNDDACRYILGMS